MLYLIKNNKIIGYINSTQCTQCQLDDDINVVKGKPNQYWNGSKLVDIPPAPSKDHLWNGEEWISTPKNKSEFD